MNPFTAAVWQTTSLPYDKEANLARALRAMEAAHARGASLLVLPEMFLTGYLIRDRLEELAEPVPDGPSLLVLRDRPAPSPWAWWWACLWPTPAASPTTPW